MSTFNYYTLKRLHNNPTYKYILTTTDKEQEIDSSIMKELLEISRYEIIILLGALHSFIEKRADIDKYIKILKELGFTSKTIRLKIIKEDKIFTIKNIKDLKYKLTAFFLSLYTRPPLESEPIQMIDATPESIAVNAIYYYNNKYNRNYPQLITGFHIYVTSIPMLRKKLILFKKIQKTYKQRITLASFDSNFSYLPLAILQNNKIINTIDVMEPTIIDNYAKTNIEILPLFKTRIDAPIMNMPTMTI